MPLGEGFYRLFRRNDPDRDIEAELESHIEMKARDLVEEGLTPEAARARAVERFGDRSRIQEECRAIRSQLDRRRARHALFDTLAQDLRTGARSLIRHPRFSVAALLILALGIGGTAAIFSVFNAVILRPLPYPEPHRLVQVMEANPERMAEVGRPWGRTHVSVYNYRDYQERNTVFSQMGWIAHAADGHQMNLSDGFRPERVKTVSVSTSIFDLLGMRPVLGDVWSPEQGRYAFQGIRYAVISHRLWQRRFGGDPDIVGRTVELDTWPHEIVGVLGPDAPGLPPLELRGQASHELGGADVYVPLAYNAFGQPRARRQFRTIARLKPGVSVAQARQEMRALSQGLEEAYPDQNAGWSAEVIALQDVLSESLGPRLGLLLGATALVLLMACANTANLLLAQGKVREQEMGIRASLGGGRWRLVRQLLTENLFLAVVAGSLGLLIAYGGNRFLVALIPPGVPRAQQTGVDLTVLGFTLFVTLATTLLFGLVPALRASRVDVAEVMKGTHDLVSAAGGRRDRRFQRALIVGQIALAVVLLVGGGLLARSFLRATAIDLGFDTRNVLSISLWLGKPNLYNSEYFECDLARDQRPDGSPLPLLGQRCRPKDEAWQDFFERVRAQVEAVPGVRSAALGSPILQPASFMGHGTEVSVGAPPGSSEGSCVGTGYPAGVVAAYPGYFETLGIDMVAGRGFTAADTDWRTAIVNRTLAQRLWPGESPLGKRIGIWGGCEATVVGVAEETRHYPLEDRYQHGERLDRMLYQKGFGAGGGAIFARTAGPAEEMTEAVRAAIEEMGTGVPVGSITPLEEQLGATLATPRFYALLVGIFAGFAVALVAGGLYGTVAFAVSQRTREIGLRRALGASENTVKRMLVVGALRTVFVGIALGVAGAYATVQILAGFLYGMDPVDPVTFGVVSVTLAAVVLLASYLPARRATRVDPMKALQHE